MIEVCENRDDNQDLFDMCRSVESELQLPARFDKLDPETLIGGDIFPCINESILKRFYGEIAEHVVKIDLIMTVSENRRTAGWYERFGDYFDCLYYIGKMQEFYQEHVEGFHIVEPKRIWTLYTTDLFNMDSFYRHFHYAFGNSLKNANEVIEDGLKHSTYSHRLGFHRAWKAIHYKPCGIRGNQHCGNNDEG